MKKHHVSPRPQSSFLRSRWGKGLLWSCVAAVAAAIFCFSAQNGIQSSGISNALADFIISLVDPDFALRPAAQQAGALAFTRRLVRKGAHFLEFAALGFSLRMLVGAYGLRHPTCLCLAAGALYAATDELHQLFVSSRACMWQDVLLDSCGVLAGITVAYALMVLAARVRRHLKPGAEAAETEPEPEDAVG